jgi:hypothetical protein
VVAPLVTATTLPDITLRAESFMGDDGSTVLERRVGPT